jgi:hypothetical protein
MAREGGDVRREGRGGLIKSTESAVLLLGGRGRCISNLSLPLADIGESGLAIPANPNPIPFGKYPDPDEAVDKEVVDDPGDDGLISPNQVCSCSSGVLRLPPCILKTVW